jgi:hypothetical protein
LKEWLVKTKTSSERKHTRDTTKSIKEKMTTRNNQTQSPIDAPRYTTTQTNGSSSNACFEKITRAIGKYAGKEFGYEMKILVLQHTETFFPAPTLPEKPSRQEELAWGKDYDMYLRKKEIYEVQKAKVFTLIYGQCDTPMKNRVDAHDDYKTADQNRNVVALLKMIKHLATEANEKKLPAKEAMYSWIELLKMRQGSSEDLTKYYKRFKSTVEHVERSYGPISPVAAAEKDIEYDKAKKKTTEKVAAQMLACVFMRGADHKMYGHLMKELDNDYTLGDSKYPDTVEDALEIMTVYYERNKNRRSTRSKINEELGLTFAQTNQTTKEEMMQLGLCFKCGKKGHRAFECKEKGPVQALQTKTEDSDKFPWQV